MGVNATQVYYTHKKNHKLTDEDITSMMSTVNLVSDINESKSIVNDTNPKIVIAGSGMISGGRVLHYLDKLISDKKNSILIVGFQAEGTRGKALLAGETEIKFFGEYHSIKADIFKINAFSGHADQSELLDCLQKNITSYVSANFNSNLTKNSGLKPGIKRLFVIFKIDKEGNIADVQARAPHKALQDEAVRVVSSIPKMIPGKYGGQAVGVKYSLPIAFKVD